MAVVHESGRIDGTDLTQASITPLPGTVFAAGKPILPAEVVPVIHMKGDRPAESIRFDEPPANNRRKANWARLIQKVYEVDPLKCTRCGATMRIIALIDDAGVIERILKHLSVWEPQPETRSPAGPDPPWPKGETIPLTYHPVPDIA
jgi:hypothetical protein